jgi:hypothetical protein
MAPQERVMLLVEGRDDQMLVGWILEAAGLPADRVEILVGHGKMGVRWQLQALPEGSAERVAVLIDLDERSVPDAQARAREQLAAPDVRVFCAVPTIEAWLFADDRLAEEQCAGDDEALAILRRIPMPEEIPTPKELARTIFGLPQHCQWLRKLDVERAAARSPSLRTFLVGIGEMLGVPVRSAAESVGRSLSRNVLSGLLAEVFPSDTVVWRTTDGDAYTAGDLRHHIEQGDEIGQQYASDLLRVSRDFLRRAAARAAVSTFAVPAPQFAPLPLREYTPHVEIPKPADQTAAPLLVTTVKR